MESFIDLCSENMGLYTSSTETAYPKNSTTLSVRYLPLNLIADFCCLNKILSTSSCLSVNSIVCLSVRLSTCLSVCLSFCLSLAGGLSVSYLSRHVPFKIYMYIQTIYFHWYYFNLLYSSLSLGCCFYEALQRLSSSVSDCKSFNKRRKP